MRDRIAASSPSYSLNLGHGRIAPTRLELKGRMVIPKVEGNGKLSKALSILIESRPLKFKPAQDVHS